MIARAETGKPHAALVAQDFPGIGRGDRRDAIGEIQTGFQEPDLSIIFDAMHGERLGGKSIAASISRGNTP